MIVPVILITGFLGAGKTTLINEIIKNNPDKKISLILNEFGDIKLESKFVEAEGVGMVSELSGGCLCCVASADLPRVIRYTLEHAPVTQYLIIEASGLSDPDPVRATLMSPELSSLIRLDTTVAVVDADNFATTSMDHPLVLSQIAEADYGVISKTTNHKRVELELIRDRVASIGLGTQTFIWDNTFDTTILFDPPLTTHHTTHSHHHSHTSYDQYYYHSDKSHDINKLSQTLSGLGVNVLRVKGYSGDYLLQKVGHHVDIRNADHKGSGATMILVIGTGLSDRELSSLFASCITIA